jgi:hypothetical protein
MILTRFAQNDEEDIQNIIATDRVDRGLLCELATDAITVGVGFQKRHVETNLELVMEIFDAKG